MITKLVRAFIGLFIIQINKSFVVHILQVIFEAMKGADSNAFLALDDVSFTPGCVQSSTPLPRSTTTPPPTTRNARGMSAP